MSTFLTIMHIVCMAQVFYLDFQKLDLHRCLPEQMPSIIVEFKCLILCWNYCCLIKVGGGKSKNLCCITTLFSCFQMLSLII